MDNANTKAAIPLAPVQPSKGTLLAFLTLVALWIICTPVITFGVMLLWLGLQGGTSKLDAGYFYILGTAFGVLPLAGAATATWLYHRPARLAKRRPGN